MDGLSWLHCFCLHQFRSLILPVLYFEFLWLRSSWPPNFIFLCPSGTTCSLYFGSEVESLVTLNWGKGSLGKTDMAHGLVVYLVRMYSILQLSKSKVGSTIHLHLCSPFDADPSLPGNHRVRCVPTEHGFPWCHIEKSTFR